VTFEECKPWIDYRRREVIFRETVIAFLTGGEDRPESTDEQYCRACKAAKRDHCDTCSRDFRAIGKDHHV
jgi:hypothetical protein